MSREAGIDLQLAELDRDQRKTQDGTVLSTVNPKNQVPVLELDNGQRFTEGPVMVQYLADEKPGSGSRPAARHDGTLPRAGMAQFHHLGIAQDVRPHVPPDHAGRF